MPNQRNRRGSHKGQEDSVIVLAGSGTPPPRRPLVRWNKIHEPQPQPPEIQSIPSFNLSPPRKKGEGEGEAASQIHSEVVVLTGKDIDFPGAKKQASPPPPPPPNGTVPESSRSAMSQRLKPIPLQSPALSSPSPSPPSAASSSSNGDNQKPPSGPPIRQIPSGKYVQTPQYNNTWHASQKGRNYRTTPPGLMDGMKPHAAGLPGKPPSLQHVNNGTSGKYGSGNGNGNGNGNRNGNKNRNGYQSPQKGLPGKPITQSGNNGNGGRNRYPHVDKINIGPPMMPIPQGEQGLLQMGNYTPQLRATTPDFIPAGGNPYYFHPPLVNNRPRVMNPPPMNRSPPDNGFPSSNTQLPNSRPQPPLYNSRANNRPPFSGRTSFNNLHAQNIQGLHYTATRGGPSYPPGMQVPPGFQQQTAFIPNSYSPYYVYPQPQMIASEPELSKPPPGFIYITTNDGRWKLRPVIVESPIPPEWKGGLGKGDWLIPEKMRPPNLLRARQNEEEIQKKAGEENEEFLRFGLAESLSNNPEDSQRLHQMPEDKEPEEVLSASPAPGGHGKGEEEHAPEIADEKQEVEPTGSNLENSEEKGGVEECKIENGKKEDKSANEKKRQ